MTRQLWSMLQLAQEKQKVIDNIIIDTAGRLHTQTNLAKELQKMVRTANKAMEGAPHSKNIHIRWNSR